MRIFPSLYSFLFISRSQQMSLLSCISTYEGMEALPSSLDTFPLHLNLEMSDKNKYIMYNMCIEDGGAIFTRSYLTRRRLRNYGKAAVQDMFVQQLLPLINPRRHDAFLTCPNAGTERGPDVAGHHLCIVQPTVVKTTCKVHTYIVQRRRLHNDVIPFLFALKHSLVPMSNFVKHKRSREKKLSSAHIDYDESNRALTF